jgi:hypothetical protein
MQRYDSISSSVGERKIMKHFVVQSLISDSYESLEALKILFQNVLQFCHHRGREFEKTADGFL